MDKRDRPLAALAALNEPLRHRLYRHVASHASPVSRDDASGALGIPRSVAAFHLDKLAKLGLLEIEYHRPPGRDGPGAGRPAKFYRRAAGEIAMSVPERRYDLAARLLAQAVESALDPSVPIAEALRTAARDYGHTIGARFDPAARRSRRRLLARLADLLAEHGYEPRVGNDRVTLANCPFQMLAEDHRGLVCGMNHDLIEGVLEAAGITEVDARLDPAPGRCCVALVAGERR